MSFVQMPKVLCIDCWYGDLNKLIWTPYNPYDPFTGKDERDRLEIDLKFSIKFELVCPKCFKSDNIIRR